MRDDDLALEELGHAARLSGGNSKTLGLHGFLLATRGRRDEAQDVLRTIESISASRHLPP